MRVYKHEGCLPLVRDWTAIGQMREIQIHMSAFGVKLGETGNRQKKETRPSQHRYLFARLTSRRSSQAGRGLALIRHHYRTKNLDRQEITLVFSFLYRSPN